MDTSLAGGRLTGDRKILNTGADQASAKGFREETLGV